MIAPFTVTILYRKEGISDEIDGRRLDLEDYYEKHIGDIDLMEVDVISQGYWDKNLTTTVMMKSNKSIIVFMNFRDMRKAIATAQLDFSKWNLLTNSQ